MFEPEGDVVSSDAVLDTVANSVALQLDVFGIAVEFASRGAILGTASIELRGP